MARINEQDRYARVAQNKDMNFVPFTKSEAYRAENRALLRNLVYLLPNNFVIADLGAGTGLGEQELIPLCKEFGKSGTILAVEPDDFAREQAEKDTPQDPSVKVEWVKGLGEDLDIVLEGKIPSGGLDAVIMLDAFHEVTGRDTETNELKKEVLLRKAAAATKEDGFLLINTNFTTEGLSEEDGTRQGRWFMQAYKLAGGRTSRNREEIQASDADDSTKMYKPEEYLEMFRKAGFTRILTYRRIPVTLDYDALKAISRYPRFVDGAFERYEPDEGKTEPDIKVKSQALIDALDQRGITGLRRRWRDYFLQKVPAQSDTSSGIESSEPNPEGEDIILSRDAVSNVGSSDED